MRTKPQTAWLVYRVFGAERRDTGIYATRDDAIAVAAALVNATPAIVSTRLKSEVHPAGKVSRSYDGLGYQVWIEESL